MTETEFQSNLQSVNALHAASPRRVTSCPFREGPETVDMLLAEVGTRHTAVMDALLDFRVMMARREDAWAAVEQFFRLRRLLGKSCYLAFYRVRCWLRRELIAEVRPCRGAPWQQVDLPSNVGNLNEALNTCLASLPDDACPGNERWNGQVRFRFLS
jgi:hypothetical protein